VGRSTFLPLNDVAIKGDLVKGWGHNGGKVLFFDLPMVWYSSLLLVSFFAHHGISMVSDSCVGLLLGQSPMSAFQARAVPVQVLSILRVRLLYSC